MTDSNKKVVASDAKLATTWWSRRVTADYRGKSKMDGLGRMSVTASMKNKVIRQVNVVSAGYGSTNPYFTLIRSSFSNMGSAANHRKSHVAAACTQSMGKPVTK